MTLNQSTLSNSFTKGIIFVSALFLVTYGALLFWTNGLPYAMDNNESFSNLVHAQNLVHFGIDKTKGLADETPDVNPLRPQSHPFVHTHQGNFPRLFSTVLYLLGAQSIESQIIITTFTIGLLSVLLAYLFVSRIGSPFLGALFCFFMITDYLLFAQWTVNTWRVWQPVFLFSTLLLVDLTKTSSRRKWCYIGIGATMTCAFYGEFAFASFVFITGLVYAIFLHARTDRWAVFAIACSLFIGAAIALSILAIQLIAYLGWKDCIQDAIYTISSRNFLNTREAREKVMEFYGARNVLFHPNFAADPSVRTLDWVKRSFFFYNFSIWTPAFTTLVACLVLGAVIHLLGQTGKCKQTFCALIASALPSSDAKFGVPKKPSSIVSLGVVYVACAFCLINLTSDQQAIGLEMMAKLLFLPVTFAQYVSIGLLSAVLTLGIFFVWKYVCGGKELNWTQLAIATGVLLLVCIFARRSVVDYPYAASSIWKMIYFMPLVRLITLFLFVFVIWYLFIQSFSYRSKTYQFLNKITLRLFFASAAAGCGFIFAWLWAPGYIFSGYFVRTCPFISYILYLLPALGVYGIWESFKSCGINKGSTSWERWLPLVWKLSLLVAIGSFAALWICIQANYLFLIPPTLGKFLQSFRNPEFQNASFAITNYPLPFAQLTKGWALIQHRSDAVIDLQPGKSPMPMRMPPECFWFADRAKNPSYRRPQYLVHFGLQHSLGVIAYRAHTYVNGRVKKARPDYDDVPMIQSIENKESPFKHKLVSKDESPWGLWAIVEIDYGPLPYLLPLQDTVIEESQMLKPKSEMSVVNIDFKPYSANALDLLQNGYFIDNIYVDGCSLYDENTVIPFSGNLPERNINARVVAKNKQMRDGKRSDEELYSCSISVEGRELKIVLHPDIPNGLLTLRIGGSGYKYDIRSKHTEAPVVYVPLITSKGKLEEDEKKPDYNGLVGLGYYVQPHFVQKDQEQMAIYPQYRFAHDGGVREQGSIWRLWELRDGRWKVVRENTSGEPFIVSNNSDKDYMLSVIPVDDKRRGFEYHSVQFLLPSLIKQTGEQIQAHRPDSVIQR